MNAKRTIGTIDLKLEKVNPLSQAGMNAADNPGTILHHEESIVFQRRWHRPMTRSRHSCYSTHVAQEPAEEINQMDSLFHELPAADNPRIGTPFPLDPFATGD